MVGLTARSISHIQTLTNEATFILGFKCAISIVSYLAYISHSHIISFFVWST